MTFRPYTGKVRLGNSETFLDVSELPDGYVLSREGTQIIATLIDQSKLALETPSKDADAATKGYVDSEVGSEESARIAGDSGLQSSLTSETSARVAGDAALQTEIDTEESARAAGDAALSTSLDNEASTRAAAVVALQGSVASEESARIAGDSNLQNQINNLLSNVDPDSLDSLSEIVSAFQDADGYLLEVVQNLSTGSSSALGLETSARIAADVDLQSEIDAEESARAAGDAALSTSLGNEASARAAADTALQGEIDAEESARVAGDAGLSTALDNETSARIAANTALQGDIDAEESARAAGDAALTTNLGNEASARAAADTALQGEIDAEESARVAGDTTLTTSLGLEASARVAQDGYLHDLIVDEVERASGAEEALQGNIDAEASVRAAAVISLQGEIDTEESARAAQDTVLQGNIDAEASARAAAIATLSGDLDLEESARIAQDQSLQGNISSEASARAAADAGLAGDLDVEESARIAGDSNLQTQINNLLSNVTPDSLDSLSEIVSAFQNADGYLLEVVQNLSTGSNSALGLETSARIAADTALEGEIDAEASVRAAGDTALSTSISTETSARIAADATKLALSGDTMTGSLTMSGGATVTGLPAASAESDAVSKSYAEDYFLGGSGSHTLLVQEGGQFATIQAAIDAAVDGDVILVGPKAAGWGSISITSAKKITIAGYAQAATGQKLCRVSGIDLNLASGTDPNLCEINIVGLFVGASVASPNALVRFTGAGSARLRLRSCGIFKSGTGDSIESSNSGAGSSFYIEDCFINTQGVDGTTLKHVSGFTQVQGRSILVNGGVVASCAAGDLVIVGCQLSAGASSAGPALQTTGGTFALGTSSVAYPKADGVGAEVSSGAILGVDQVSFLIGTGAALATGKAITGAGTLILGEATYGPALVYSSVVDAAVTPAVKAGGALNSALSMSPNGGTTKLKITNLANGTDANDAVTLSQLQSAITAIDPAGSAGQIQFNADGYDFGASANLTWDNAQNSLFVGGAAKVNGVVSLGEVAEAPAGEAGYGKLFAKTDDGLYFVDSEGVSHYILLDGYVQLSGTSVDLDASPSLPVYRSLSMTGATTFTTSNLGVGRSVSVRLVAGASERTVTFPAGWSWLGGATPTAVPANKVALLSFVAYGPADTDVIAAWSYNDSEAISGGGTTGQVAFYDGTRSISGEANLTWDAENDRLVVGTVASPAANLHVGGSTQVDGAVTMNGAVTIGDGYADVVTVNGTATFNQPVSMGSNKITDLANPSSNNDAVNLAFLESRRLLTIQTIAGSGSVNATTDVVFVTGSGGSVIRLPEAVAGNAGKVIVIKKRNSGAEDNIGTASGSGQSIDGDVADASSNLQELMLVNESLTFISDGSNWFII